jgi:hypothetical protein
MNQSSRAFRYLPWITLALALISLACFAVPMYVIRPFRHQGSAELRLALFVKQIGPWLSTSCAVIALVIVILRLAAGPRMDLKIVGCVFAGSGDRGWISRTVEYL